MAAKVERLVNLTIALLETSRPLSFEQINSKTRRRFYGQADFNAARRMFERDKDELRRLGVPIETKRDPYEDVDGYIISRREYEFPGVDLSQDEVAALTLAVRLTGPEGTPLAFAKLAASAPDPAELPTPTTEVRFTPTASDAVAKALATRTAVEFSYRTANGNVGTRKLDPYGIVQRKGASYLVGRDHDRDALRAFRFDRMSGELELVGDPNAFVLPDGADLAAVVDVPDQDIEVVLAVTGAADWSVQLRGGQPDGQTDDGRTIYRVSGFQPTRDRAWLLGLADEVTVLSPQTVANDMIAALKQVEEAHNERD